MAWQQLAKRGYTPIAAETEDKMASNRFKPVSKTFRVQIPAYTDWWMRGARYGEVIAECDGGIGGSGPLWRVRLDANGRVIACIQADCTDV